MITQTEIEAFAVQIAEQPDLVVSRDIEPLIGHLSDIDHDAVLMRSMEIRSAMGNGNNPCERCGRPVTSAHEFFRTGERRIWMHIACMIEGGEEAIASGKFDDLRIGMNRGDGTAEITTGKQLRESARGMIEQTEGGGRFKPTKLRVVT